MRVLQLQLNHMPKRLDERWLLFFFLALICLRKKLLRMACYLYGLGTKLL